MSTNNKIYSELLHEGLIDFSLRTLNAFKIDMYVNDILYDMQQTKIIHDLI